jgi:hypothetical protein
MVGAGMVPEMSIIFNQVTWLITQDDFIKLELPIYWG